MTLAPLACLALAAAPADRLDALDFEHGTLLVKAGASYGTDVSDWAPWRLSDGSGIGWCSATGQPRGASFEWALDGTWRLEALVVDTTTTEEDDSPGVSAKTLELLVATGEAPWRSLGRFVVPRRSKKDFALPRGTTATRVKVTVVDNHGHPELTEVAELDLLGRREQPPATATFTGTYESTYGPLRLEQEGDQLWGCYEHGDGASLLWGSVTGRVAQLTWYEEDGGGGDAAEGTATFAVGPGEDGRPGFWGVWYQGGQLAGTWTGAKDPARTPRCTVRREGALERQLRQKGHVALYGIRFDPDKDTPRPESEATLKALAALLSRDPALAVVIEGHTDATNTDAYNLDLSKRRAAAVVRRLTELGARATQLEARGLGRTRPVADNATAQGRALNRRVEVARAGR